MLTGKSILIVDDEEDLRDLLMDVMKSSGATVFGAENGTQAFEMIQNQKYDAVVTDIRMPDGDGVSLIKNINTLLLKPKVFVCSAFNDLQPSEFTALGVSEVFGKPFKRKSMIETIAKALT